MPIYEYRCSQCGVFEATQRITERPLKRCPTCQGKVERIISATSFVLKGSGWYATDYARAAGTQPSETAAGRSESQGASANGNAPAAASSNDTTAKPASGKPATDKPATDKQSPAAKPAD